MKGFLALAFALAGLASVHSACVTSGCMQYTVPGSTTSTGSTAYSAGCYSASRCVNRINDGVYNSGSREWLAPFVGNYYTSISVNSPAASHSL